MRGLHKKIPIWIFIVPLSLPFIAQALKFYTHEIYKRDIAHIHACNVYGPTLKPRPSNEWCHKRVLQNTIPKQKVCIKTQDGNEHCLDEKGRIPLECIFDKSKEDWCISLKVIKDPKQ
jgi:hypothetical protein